MILINCFLKLTLTNLVTGRYGADCTVLAAPGSVTTRCNGMTIAPRRALLCTPITAHSTPSTAVSRIIHPPQRIGRRLLSAHSHAHARRAGPGAANALNFAGLAATLKLLCRSSVLISDLGSPLPEQEDGSHPVVFKRAGDVLK